MARTTVVSLLAGGLLAVAAATAGAAPVSFSVKASGFVLGAGYGDTEPVNELPANATLLNVAFTADGTLRNFTLNNPGDTQSFTFGTVSLLETGLISPGETDALGVAAVFHFFDPTSGFKAVTATGSATTGLVNDTDIDFSIDWDPITVDFGDNGLFSINLGDIDIRLSETVRDLTATVRLLRAPNEIPEPTSLLLASLGLAALGVSRRQRRRGG